MSLALTMFSPNWNLRQGVQDSAWYVLKIQSPLKWAEATGKMQMSTMGQKSGFTDPGTAKRVY